MAVDASGPAAASTYGTSDGGISGSHPAVAALQVKAGPATEEEFDTVRMPLIPVACWRVDDIRFPFDSSVVLPEVRDELQSLSALLRTHAEPDPPDGRGRKPPLSVFGHADPVGNDDYNKALSGRRAAAIYGLLTRRDEIWEDLYSNKGTFAAAAAGDRWGTGSIQIMLSALVHPIATDGVKGEETTAALREFQSSHGLPADGEAGPATRKQLFLAYMDNLCVDAAGKPFQVDRTEGFLARNQDAAGKADFQGCGEFNPLLIFSQQEDDEFQKAEDKTQRNAANAPNRRVMVLLFRPGSRVDPARWPCPRAKDGTSACRKRFWSDGEKRRSLRLAAERKFEETKDTFACRFYHRLAVSSPCERILRVFKIRLFDPFGKALAGAPYLVKTANREVRGRSNPDGDAIVLDVPVPGTCAVKWSRPNATEEEAEPLSPERQFADEGDAEAMDEFRQILAENHDEFEYQREVFVDFEGDERGASPGMSAEEARRRLHNLGYSAEALLEAQVRAYQRDTGRTPTGELADIQADLKARHDGLKPPPEFTA